MENKQIIASVLAQIDQEKKQENNFKGLLIRCGISWDSREDYDNVIGNDYARIEVWWDNTKDRNDPTGWIKTIAYRKKVGEELWKVIKWEYNNNRDYDTFYSITVDNNGELLDFKEDKEFRKLVKVLRAMEVQGCKAYELSFKSYDK